MKPKQQKLPTEGYIDCAITNAVALEVASNAYAYGPMT